ncbi:vomeronasal type-2 receptor 26-like [Pelobates fuscus]|uniref:vomeronasal type-2 receptor 26-like n=1 Tax=Pelobates fuscus TaxID=191477 RepID=UPI002FE439AF
MIIITVLFNTLMAIYKLLKVLAIILLLCSDCSDAAQLSKDWSKPNVEEDIEGYFRDGDLILGGIILLFNYHYSNHYKSYTHAHVYSTTKVCDMPSLRFIRHFLAFDFAVQEINNDRNLLPNTTLGYSIYDSCFLANKAQEATLRILSGGRNHPFNYSCKKNYTVVAFIGHFLSSVTRSMADILSIYGYTQLRKYLRSLHFNTSSGNEFTFHETRNSKTHFELLQYIYLNNTLKTTHIGDYILTANSETNLYIKERSMIWESDIKGIPQSMCNERCPPGYRKANPREETCCYSCVQCSPGEISNQTDMENCLLCPEDEYPDVDQVTCLPRTIDFLSYHEPLGATLASFAVMLFFITTVILGIFIMYRHTPIVRANNTYLSYIILFSLMLSFLFCLLFFGSPNKITCMLQNAIFNIIYAVALSSVLTKTIIVLVAFSVVKPGSKFRIFLRSRISIFIVMFFCFGEVGICFWWLTSWPPFPDKDSKVEVAKLILHCNVGSLLLFYVTLGYNWLLALCSFIVAFLAKQLPDLFNEARYITFSMLVFCSVWVSFIPAYMSTKGKSMVAVEVFAILASSTGILGCIFLPKCYIIIFRPELNTKQSLCGTGFY